MGLCEYLAAVLVVQQLVAAEENSSGLRLTTGLSALLGDLPMSSSLPALPPLPTLESCGTSEISLPLLPPLPSGDCLPPLPVAPYESALPAPSKHPCFCKRSLQLRRRCKCRRPRPIPCGYGLTSAPFLPAPTYQQPCLPPPCLEPYPPLKPKAGCLEVKKKKQASTELIEKIILKKGLTLGLGPDCGSDIGLLPDAVSTFAVDTLVGPLVQELDDCSF